MPGDMVVDLAVDRNLHIFGEFLSLECGNKCDPLGPTASAFFDSTVSLLLWRAISVTFCTIFPVKLHFSVLPLAVKGDKTIDIIDLKTVSELLTGKDDHSA